MWHDVIHLRIHFLIEAAKHSSQCQMIRVWLFVAIHCSRHVWLFSLLLIPANVCYVIVAMPSYYHHESSHRLLSDAAADNVARWQRYHNGCDFRMDAMLMMPYTTSP